MSEKTTMGGNVETKEKLERDPYRKKDGKKRSQNEVARLFQILAYKQRLAELQIEISIREKKGEVVMVMVLIGEKVDICKRIQEIYEADNV